MKPVYIVDKFGEVVTAVSAALTPSLVAYDSLITGVHYLHGHPTEIIETLTQKDKSDTFKFTKYPLVALFQDFPEAHNQQIGIDNEATLHIIIAYSSRPTYKAEERYTLKFKPVIYPIYLELLKQITLNKAFLNYGIQNLGHTKIDRLYWGREGLYGNTGNVFNDFLDCIEIRDLKLKINLKNC
jgi:hypothetical protein